MRILVCFLTAFLTASCAAQPHGETPLAQGLAYGTPESVGMSGERLKRIDTVIQNHIGNDELAGAVVMVARQGKVDYFEKFGVVNKDTGQKMALDSIFRIYSMTKPIATVAAMTLYEEGKFQLTDPVEKYLPEFKNVSVLNENGELEEPGKPITIQMLMSHTAGFTYGFFGDTLVDQQYREAGIFEEKNIADFVTGLSTLPLQYQPGITWHYSVATDVLGRLIEVIADQPLDEFLRERIFTPLAMHDTFFQVPDGKLSRFGTNHSYNPETDALETNETPDASRYSQPVTFFSAGGGLLSTAEDYMTFCQMLLNGGDFNGVRILGPKTIEYMTTNHLPGILATSDAESNSPPSIFGADGRGFGLGFGLIVDPTQTGSISSKGEYFWGGAAGTIFWIDPVEQLIAVIMIQHMNVQVPLRRQMQAVIYGSLTDLD